MKFLLVLLTSIVASTSTSNFWNKNEKTTTVSNFYTLGDSLSDTGALANGGAQWVKALDPLIPFQKITLSNPYYQNRSFSTGAPAAELVAQSLHKTFDPAWRFTRFGKVHEHIGENYAFGGAMAGKNHSKSGLILNDFSITKQAEALVAQHKITTGDQFFMEIGGNDLMASMSEQNWWKRQMIINDAITGELTALTTLINHGAHKIVVASAPDISLTPLYNQNLAQQQLAHQLWQSYTNSWNTALQQFISQHKNIIQIFNLANKMNQALIDFAKLDKDNNIVNNAVQSNFWTWDLFAHGRVDVNYSSGVTPQNLFHYFFVDQVHPNGYIHEQFAQSLVKYFQ